MGAANHGHEHHRHYGNHTNKRVGMGETRATANSHAPAERADAPVSQAGFLPGPRARAWRQRLVTSTLVSSDVALELLVWGAAFIVQSVWGRGELSGISVPAVAATVAVWVGLRALLGLYPGYGLDNVEELRRQTYGVAAALAITSVFALAFQVRALLSRLLLGSGFVGLLLLAPLLRHFVKWWIMRGGLWGKPVMVMGAGDIGARLVRALQREWSLGLKPIAVFDNRLAPAGGALEGVPYRGTLTDAMSLARERVADTVVFAMPHARREHLMRFISRASRSFRYVIVIPNMAGITTSAAVARDLAGILGVEIKHNLLNPWIRRIKRALDLLGVVAGGLLIGPLVLAIVGLIKLDSSGPAFYTQLRLGKGGNHFRCWTFRTMHVDADWLLTQHLQDNAELRWEWEQDHKLRFDPRVTRAGRFLRATSLDELPQLWNVVRGEMSLVGPRPIVDKETPKYGKVYKLYQRVTPGISGLWQVSGRNNTTYEERVALDAYYVRNWSLWLDLVILARTVGSTVLRRGAY
jgi:Undecaprenyl-phosphate galactose phosphotransferase WbaP